MKLKATKRYTYANRQLQEGDLFTAKNRQDHRVLLALRRAVEHVEGDETSEQTLEATAAPEQQAGGSEVVPEPQEDSKPSKRKRGKKGKQEQEGTPSDDQ